MFENFIDLIFISFVLTIVILAVLINVNEPGMPAIVLQTFRYGKHAYKGIPSRLVSQCEIPKAYFKHFYAFAIVWAAGIFSLSWLVYVQEWSAPGWVMSSLDLLCGANREVTTSPLTTFLAISLLSLQCARRFYETYWIQVFSDSSKINITHYLVGYFHYFGAFLVIVAQGPGFVYEPIGQKHSLALGINQLSVHHIVSVALFLYAWFHQFKCNLILANLRKNKSGSVVTQKHLLPVGSFFEHVSAPHMFFEIVMYFALYILLFGNTSWIYVLLWVFTNQIENAWLCHRWYLETFPDYPTERRAIFPHLI